MEEPTYWVNGEFVPASRAMMPINSRGYRLGDGVFDTERTFNGQLFKLEAHLERLSRSLKVLRIELGMSLEQLARVTRETVERNLHRLATDGDWWVTQTIHRGGGMNPLQAAPPFISIIVEPLAFARFAPYYTKGAHLVIPAGRSSALGGMDPKLKAISRLGMVLADVETKQVDEDAWPLVLDEDGNLAEVYYGNLFLVRDGKVRTPTSRAILEGVTRATTMELVQAAGYHLIEQNLQPYDLYTAAEAFITTTSYCVLPVGKLNGAAIGRDVPGPVTQRIMEAWNGLAGFDIAEQMRQFAVPSTPSTPSTPRQQPQAVPAAAPANS